MLGLTWYTDIQVANGAHTLPSAGDEGGPDTERPLRAAYVEFVAHLVSANGNLVEPCIRVLVARLLPPEGNRPHTAACNSSLL